jgi:hypothetical protein
MSQKAKLSDLSRKLQQHAEKTAPKTKEHPGKGIEANAPRGERANFLKITITMPADMLGALKDLGIKRKATGETDTDVSSLIRESVVNLLNKRSS